MYSAYKHAKGIIHIWTMKDPWSETSPLMFSDAISEMFFFSTIVRALEYAYRAGKRDERRARKKKSTEKWKRDKRDNSNKF